MYNFTFKIAFWERRGMILVLKNVVNCSYEKIYRENISGWGGFFFKENVYTLKKFTKRKEKRNGLFRSLPLLI